MAKAIRKNNLAAQRKLSRLTQAEVAKMLDLDITTVCKHEQGTRGLTHVEIEKYAKLYKVSSYELFMEPERDDTVES